MDRIAIKPDKRLKTKLHLIILFITIKLIGIGLVLQFTVTLGRVTMGEAAVIIWPLIFGLIILMWIISAPIIFYWVKNLSYYIENERITIHKGIITKIEQNIPYRAITDFMLHRSLLDRFLHIGSIRIQTAGQSATPTGYEANLSGLIQYEELLEELRKRLKLVHDDTTTAVSNVSPDSRTDDILKQILEELTLIRKEIGNKS